MRCPDESRDALARTPVAYEGIYIEIHSADGDPFLAVGAAYRRGQAACGSPTDKTNASQQCTASGTPGDGRPQLSPDAAPLDQPLTCPPSPSGACTQA